MGRHLPTLKAELGKQARAAFQALAALKLAPVASVVQPAKAPAPGARSVVTAPPAAVAAVAQHYTAWTFGELPELMEVQRGAQSLVGCPALLDKGAHVEIEVFDEPGVAALRHRAGLRRLVALQIKEPLKYLEKNIPDLTRMAVADMAFGGSSEELRDQIVEVALDRAFLAEPLPTEAAAFGKRVDEGRARLNLIAQVVARQAAAVLAEHAVAVRKLKDARPAKEVTDDVAAQLARHGDSDRRLRFGPLGMP